MGLCASSKVCGPRPEERPYTGQQSGWVGVCQDSERSGGSGKGRNVELQADAYVRAVAGFPGRANGDGLRLGSTPTGTMDGLIFIDLRDRHGITQLVFEKGDAPQAVLEAADSLRNEDVLAATGEVRIRKGGENPKLPTGKVEVVVSSLTVLNKTENPPFLPDDGQALPNEELRLKHRYIDLRRGRMQQILGMRHPGDAGDAAVLRRERLPRGRDAVLYKSTPEGAREFLVPSRHQPGTWYALAAEPAALQADPDGGGRGPVHADLPVLP